MELKPDSLFGALAVQEGFASEAEVEVALVTQKDAASDIGGVNARLGQILLEMGAISSEHLIEILKVMNGSARLPQQNTNGNGTAPSTGAGAGPNGHTRRA